MSPPNQTTLWIEDESQQGGGASVAHAGPFASVALDQGVDRLLDYSIPKSLQSLLHAGQRVVVPLGRKNRPVRGYVVAIRETSDYPKVKPVRAIDDERVLVDGKLMVLARWMSRYYVAPLGAVIESMVPAAVKKKIGVGYTQVARANKTKDELQAVLEKTKAPKRRAIVARLLQLEEGEAIEMVRLAGESGATVPTVRKLARLGLITVKSEPDVPKFVESFDAGSGRTATGVEVDDGARVHELNQDQQRVFDELKPRLSAGSFSVNLLHGVTGSGKTEIYLRSISEVVATGKRAIVLVPEIALTPQTVHRFTARFPRVAILHSGLNATQRHRYWQQIARGGADVVVGARSAVFAPVPELGIIVVDEEHESSYKQDTAPRYHARDVAIKRGQLEGVPVLLGSATPSLESWNRVQETGEPASAGGSSAHHLLKLPNRVRGLALPHVELIDMRTERRMRRGIHVISQRLETLLRHTIDTGHQAILLLNRRGYSNFVCCSSCGHVVQCKYCDTTMTYHRSAGENPMSASIAKGLHTGQLHCHYCLAVNALPEVCPACGKKLSLFGLGTQRVEEELTKKFPDLKFARVDSDSMRGSRDYEETLGKFARRELQVMLGTQMIAKGLDYPNVTLVGVISGDTALALPDFRAAERTFQLITQVAGRAGRGDAPGRVVLQSFLPDDPTIRAAIKQDFEGFARTELAHRKQIGLPPFARMVRIIVRDQDADKANQYAEALGAQLTAAMNALPVKLRGPMPCPIARIAGYYRVQIVLSSARAAAIQQVLAAVREKGDLARGERVAVDVDPVSLL